MVLQLTALMWCGVWCPVTCGAMSGVVWCCVVCCGVLWCAEDAVTKRQWLGCLAYGNSKTGRGVCARALCWGRSAPARRLGSPQRPAVSVQGRCGDSLPLRLLVRCRSRKAHAMAPPGPAGALHTVALPCGCGQWNSCISLPHCPGVVGSGTPAGTPPHCLGAAGSGSPVACYFTVLEAAGSGPPTAHHLTALGQWAVGPT